MKKKTLLLGTLSLSFIFCIAAILLHHEVNNSLSVEDKRYIPLYLKNVDPLPAIPTYEDQLKFIISVQHSVLKNVSENVGLPFDQLREPKELYEAKTGLCYDRSRVIEKILNFSGFETRHIAMFSTEKTNSSFKSIITPGIPSHAITEVLTKNGWLIVDSNYPWVSLNAKRNPISIDKLKSDIDKAASMLWDEAPPINIYLESFTFIYGLYSRHGHFYPPYNFLPDVHYGELAQNIL